jgi:hypothetical protein
MCTGGLPRPRPGMSQIESIQRVPVAAAVSPPYPCEDPDLTRVAYECLWSDPAKTQVLAAYTSLLHHTLVHYWCHTLSAYH